MSPSYISAASGSYPMRTGNRVRPLVDGPPIFRRIGEAVEAAQHSVWLTVAFYSHAFRFPDGQGALFDVLDRAVARGVDVRLLIWRPNPENIGRNATFAGTAADRELLGTRGSRFRIRWDGVPGRYCQHQKTWMIDAGQPSETAFVGGANLSAHALERHDVYVEVAGPSATDVHHNFVQRWNESSERDAEDGSWACDATDRLAFPSRASPLCGSSTVQIQRMLHRDRYIDGHAAPGGQPFDVAKGERSILDQYERAIDSAQRTIYLENQAIPIPQIADRLARALDRGVEIVLLVPAEPEAHVIAARRDPVERAPFESLEALGRHPNFLLAGIAEPGPEGRRPKYVHTKLMVVDDAWTTVGSCNLHRFSLSGHSEMNASIWDAAVARELRCTLLAKHLARDTTALDDRGALDAYRRIARENRRKRKIGDADWQGQAFELDPARYALT